MGTIHAAERKIRADEYRQQEMLAAFAEYALEVDDTDLIMAEACRCVGEAVQADMALMYRLAEDKKTVVLRAGFGIDERHIGAHIRRRNEASLESDLLRGGEPVIVPDIDIEVNLETKALLKSFNQRGLALFPLLDGPGTPALGHFHVSTHQPRDFSLEMLFLRTYAGLVATSIMRIEARQVSQREKGARRTIERYLRLIIENIPQLVWCADAQACWRWASPQWREVTGQDEKASLGWGWRERVHRDDAAAIDAAWQRASASGFLDVDCRIAQEGGAYRWYSARAHPNRDDAGELSWMGTFTDIDDQRRLESLQRILLAELQHRTRNLLTVIEGVALQTANSATSWQDFEPAFQGRLQSLGRVQRLLTDADTKPVSLGDLIDMELTSVGATNGKTKLSTSGPDVHLGRSSVQMLALALHELLTNSMKYGALASGNGSISIHWHNSGATPHLTLWWHEVGFARHPLGDKPRFGFGRQLIERALPHQLGGNSSYELTADGVDCRIDVPLDVDRITQ